MTSPIDQLPAEQLLSSLSTHDVDPMRSERTRRRAHKILTRHRKCLRRWQAKTGLWYRQYLEPALVLSLVFLVLFWAFERAAFVLL